MPSNFDRRHPGQDAAEELPTVHGRPPLAQGYHPEIRGTVEPLAGREIGVESQTRHACTHPLSRSISPTTAAWTCASKLIAHVLAVLLGYSSHSYLHSLFPMIENPSGPVRSAPHVTGFP